MDNLRGVWVIWGLLAAGVSQAGDWPGVMGAGHRNDAGPSVGVVDGFARAKKLWESADPIPDGRTSDGTDKEHPTISGGFGSPVMAGDRVYLGYYVPAGDVILKWLHEKAGGPAEKWSIHASDVLHCFDIKTGKTVWRTVLPGVGLNKNFGNKGGGGQSPLMHDGRIYYCGLSMRIHCLDAASGTVLWTTPVQPRAAHVDAQVEASVAWARRNNPAEKNDGVMLKDVGGTYAANRAYLGFPIWAGGVVVTPDYVQATHPTGGKRMPLAGVAGFEPVSGRQLWQAPRCSPGAFVNPLPVTVGGAEYVLAVGPHGTSLIKPADGTVMWRNPDVNQGMGVPVLWKDIVAVKALPGETALAEEKARMERGESASARGQEPASAWKGFRITLKGPELLWTARAGTGGTPMAAAVRDGIAYLAIDDAAKKPVVWALDMATGQGADVAKPGVSGGEHDNMFTALIGNRLIACMGGNAGSVDTVRDAYCMYTLGEGGRTLVPAGAPLKGTFAWGYANSILPAFKDGIMVYRSNTRLVAVDVQGP
jgi:outer membrane protein assembly factor BamB